MGCCLANFGNGVGPAVCKNNNRMDVSNLPMGVYFAEVIAQNSKVKVKIIKK